METVEKVNLLYQACCHELSQQENPDIGTKAGLKDAKLEMQIAELFREYVRTNDPAIAEKIRAHPKAEWATDWLATVQ